MDTIKSEFIKFLDSTGALKFGEFTLKSKRSSPYFVNTGDFSLGEDLRRLGEFYALALILHKKVPDVIFGPSYKGSALAIATSMALSIRGHTVGFAYDRKEAKDHGECKTDDDVQKVFIVGAKLTKSTKVVIIDDVMTTAETKVAGINLLLACGVEEQNITAVIVAVDRQEVGIDGLNAAQEFTRKFGIPVLSIITATDIRKHTASATMETYAMCYGTRENKEGLTPVLPALKIPKRSIIPACDVSTAEHLAMIVKATNDIPEIGGYKIGFQLALRFGLVNVMLVIRKYTQKPVIYDHQKAGTDIPDTGKAFAELCSEAGVDSIILFPQSGPETERAWIYQAQKAGLHVIVGGRMTHPAYSVSEGGYITDAGALKMYTLAAECGVKDFVVPGNKPDVIQEIKNKILTVMPSTPKTQEEASWGFQEPVFWAPGFITQGGKPEEAAKVAGESWHAIVGRAITGETTEEGIRKKVGDLIGALK